MKSFFKTMRRLSRIEFLSLVLITACLLIGLKTFPYLTLTCFGASLFVFLIYFMF